MMVVSVEHEDEMTAREGALLLAAAMNDETKTPANTAAAVRDAAAAVGSRAAAVEAWVQVLPPADGFRAKERDYYRKVIYIKSNEIKGLIECRNKARSAPRL